MLSCYSAFFTPQEGFQRAVNLSLDLGNLDFVSRYIPTKASVALVGHYLRAAITPGAERASVLIGPYGKGKSHALYLALSILNEYSESATSVFAELADRIAVLDPEVADLIRAIRNKKLRLLPIIINDRYLDIRQAFLASLKIALQQENLIDYLPSNYFQCCLETINRWQQEFPTTYTAYKKYLKQEGTSSAEFENRLLQYDPQALTLFQACHRSILSGAEFDPLLESDVPTLYANVAEALQKNTNYSGLFIVFDEFGKYLESLVSLHEAPRFKVLQDLAEICARSKTPSMLMTCISHKAISDYASQLSAEKQSSFRTVEGRFEPIYFTTTFEGSFALISGALGRNHDLCNSYLDTHHAEFAATKSECDALGCFTGYESSTEDIIKQCFPMHPLTALSLMKLSEQVAQNERTLFTFLSTPDGLIQHFIRNNCGAYELATVDLVYDYFHTSIRETSYDPLLRELVIYADSLLVTLKPDEAKLIKAIVLFEMVGDQCLMARKQVLCAALQWSADRLIEVTKKLESRRIVYTRRSDGVLCLMRSSTESVRREIEHEVSARHHRIDIGTQLAELRDAGYTIPRRYNDKFSIVRYFKNTYISVEQFSKQPNSNFLRQSFADGYVIYLLGEISVFEVQRKLQQWGSLDVVVILSKIPFTWANAIEECAAIQTLLNRSTDVVETEELGYYFDDMLQVVNNNFSAMFDSQPTLITIDGIATCRTIGAEISRLCEEKLYPATPIINHEMVNRSVISGQMKQARQRVIDALLSDNTLPSEYKSTSAEASIHRAVLAHMNTASMQAVMNVITAFLSSCEDHAQSVSTLYAQLTASPYGLRKGVLPMLLAYALRGKQNEVTLYRNLVELNVSGASLSLLDDYADEFSVLLEQGGAERIAYLQVLSAAYAPEKGIHDIRGIYEAMCKVVRALPRCARANHKRLSLVDSLVKAVPLAPVAKDLRQLFIRQDGNPREILIDRLPTLCGSKPTEECAQVIIFNIESELGHYVQNMQTALVQIIKLQLDAENAHSLHGAMTTWLQRHSSAQLNRLYGSDTMALLNVMRNPDDHSDAEWINMICVALTGLPLEDWGDKQAEDFPRLLEAALTPVDENAEELEDTYDEGSYVKLSVGNLRLSQRLESDQLVGLSRVAYNTLHSKLSDFSDALTAEEKLLILANLMLHINDKE